MVSGKQYKQRHKDHKVVFEGQWKKDVLIKVEGILMDK